LPPQKQAQCKSRASGARNVSENQTALAPFKAGCFFSFWVSFMVLNKMNSGRTAFLVWILLQSSIAPAEARVVENFDAGWLFSKGDFAAAMMPRFEDSAWRQVSVPHDWRSEGAAIKRAFVFASIGPSGKLLANGDTDPDALRSAFSEQAQALASSGADAVVVDLDSLAPLGEARRQMGASQILLGNLNPVTVFA
jgi:hypothetical protein